VLQIRGIPRAIGAGFARRWYGRAQNVGFAAGPCGQGTWICCAGGPVTTEPSGAYDQTS
jgi:hypothetical protein